MFVATTYKTANNLIFTVMNKIKMKKGLLLSIVVSCCFTLFSQNREHFDRENPEIFLRQFYSEYFCEKIKQLSTNESKSLTRLVRKHTTIRLRIKILFQNSDYDKFLFAQDFDISSKERLTVKKIDSSLYLLSYFYFDKEILIKIGVKYRKNGIKIYSLEEFS